MLACQEVDTRDLDLDLQAVGHSLDRQIMVEMLLRHHADLTLKDVAGHTAVYLAVCNNDPASLKVFLWDYDVTVLCELYRPVLPRNVYMICCDI